MKKIYTYVRLVLVQVKTKADISASQTYKRSKQEKRNRPVKLRKFVFRLSVGEEEEEFCRRVCMCM